MYKSGQCKPTPPPGDATRVFYETLYKQNPGSKMATIWCVKHGVLDDKKLKKAMKKLIEWDEEERSKCG